MKLERAIEKHPERFHLPDELGEFNLIHKFIDDYLPSKAIRKKVFDGEADIEIASNTIRIHWKGNLIAEAQLQGQVETSPGTWQGQLFSFADANIKKIDWRTDVPNWDLATSYFNKDVVLHNEVNYECTLAHEENIEPGVFVGWEAYWKQLAPIIPFYRANEVKTILGIPNCVIGMDADWGYKRDKESFYLDVPGENVRLRWQCRVKDSAVYVPPVLNEEGKVVTPAKKGLQFNVQDYEGEVNHGSQVDLEPGWTIHWWTFEPTGKQIAPADSRTPKERFEQGVGLIVDPYLGVDEQANYTDVFCDGFIARVNTGDNTITSQITIYDVDGSTDLIEMWFQVPDGAYSNHYFPTYDSEYVVEIIENTPSRVKFRAIGRLDRTSGGTDNYMANHDYFECIFTIYADRISVVSHWAINATFSDWYELFWQIDAENPGNLSSVQSVYENNDSESNAATATGYPTSVDYLGMTSTEMNLISGGAWKVGYTNTPEWYVDWTHELLEAPFIDGESLSAGIHSFGFTLMFDHQDREGSAQIYNATDRIALGKQFLDTILDQSPSKGDDVTDMILPERLASGTRHSDDAHHYELDSNDELKFTLDRTRIGPNTLIHDPPFRYGTIASPTDILLCHLKLNEQAASPNLNDETLNGADGTWGNTSDASDRDTNTAGDSIQEFGRGRNLDTQNGVGYIKMVRGSGTVHDNDFLKKGSILISFIPKFNFDDAADQTIVQMGYDSGNLINFWYDETGNAFAFELNMGGSGGVLQGPTITNNYELQRPMTYLLSWDAVDGNFGMLALDGKVLFTGSGILGTPTANHPLAFEIGSDNARNLEADIVISEIKTFSECILRGCTYFIGNGEGLLADINNPHKDLCLFWDCQASGAVAAKGNTDLATDYAVTLSGATLTAGAAFLGTNGLDQGNNNNNYATIPVTSGDIFEPSSFKMGLWINVQTLANFRYFFGYNDDQSGYRLSVGINGDNYWRFYYQSNSVEETIEAAAGPVVGFWYWVEITADDNFTHLYVNGIEQGTPQAIANPFIYNTGDLQIGNSFGSTGLDCYIGRIFISKNPDTPEIWTAFGKPLHSMRTFKNGTEVQYGGTDNYQLIWTPRGEQLIVTEDEMVGP
ncbi:MAG: LamG domain-containing protein [Thermodesulfovibrionia bacterium]|nr:LamG domain-containing protein [Thermodesulfovibrionia bacterium]